MDELRTVLAIPTVIYLRYDMKPRERAAVLANMDKIRAVFPGTMMGVEGRSRVKCNEEWDATVGRVFDIIRPLMEQIAAEEEAEEEAVGPAHTVTDRAAT